MNIEDITVGLTYWVDAPGTSYSEGWVVEDIDEVDGEIIVSAKSNRRKDVVRDFTLDQIKGFAGKMSKSQILSESVELVGTVAGAEMWIEKINYMTHHERRGRKPKVEVG